jgi:hypothetical protein
MVWGPGKYDDEATLVRERVKAQGVIVVIIGGDKGDGFACQTNLSTLAMLPELLENMAQQMRQDREMQRWDHVTA